MGIISEVTILMNWAGPGIPVTLGLEGDQRGFGAHYQQTTDGRSATATMPEQLTATAQQLTTTAEQQTSIRSPQPYAPDKQGPADSISPRISGNLIVFAYISLISGYICLINSRYTDRLSGCCFKERSRHN